MSNKENWIEHQVLDLVWSLPDRYTNVTPIVTNLLDTDLGRFLRNCELEEEQIIYFIYQLLRGLKCLHSSNIIHRDLTANNIVINEDMELNIIDFGMSRAESPLPLTFYVTARFYRAPDVLLLPGKYTKAVDMWSLGCILAEMYLRKPLFNGNNHLKQLELQILVTGYPSESLLERLDEKARHFLEKQFQNSKPQRVDFKNYFKEIQSPDAIDLLDKLLQLDPNDRITCEQALEHPFVEKYHQADDEPSGALFDDSFESSDISLKEWKRLIFDEITNFVEPNFNPQE